MLLRELLDRANVDYKERDIEDEIYMCCPFCPDGDTQFKFGLNLSSGFAHCFRCGWGSRELLYTARSLSEAYGVTFRIYWTATKEKREETAKPKPTYPARLERQRLPREYETFTGDKTDAVERRVRSYLKYRGVSQSQILRHKIGFAATGRYAWRAIFPIWGEDGNDCYGFVARAVDPRQNPKYLNSEGIKSLWGTDQLGKTAVIVEGVLDALRVEQALMRRRDWVALARLGSVLTPSQFRQMRKYERLIILPDRDAAGVKGAIEVAELCAANHIQVEMAVPEEMDGRDPGGMADDEINDFIDSAQLWTNGTYYRMRKAAAN